MQAADNLYQIVKNNAQEAAHKKILIDGKLTLNNQQFIEKVEAVASYLYQMGLQPQDKVALLMTNSWQFVVNLFAINKLGGVAIPINTFLKEDEIAYILNDSDAKFLFASGKLAPVATSLLIKSKIEKIIWVDEIPLTNDRNLDYAAIIECPRSTAPEAKAHMDDLTLIIYTSGTTGKPKGAMLSFRNIYSNVTSSLQALSLTSGGARMICYLPMFHSFTLTVSVILPIVANSEIIIMRSIATKRDFALLLKQVLLKRVKYFCGVPEVFSALSRAQLPWYFYAFHAVQGFICGGAPLAEETILNFRAKFRRGTLLQGYGISECSPVVSVNTPAANRLGSVGKALPGYQVACFTEELQVVAADEIGELWVKGDCVMQGYYKRPEESAAAMVNGWFRTGDIGKIDRDGFIFIIDRKKDLIINKGMNIYPREIEEVLYTHPKVNACAVIGLKDKQENELPQAYIELKEDSEGSEEEFKIFLRPHLAVFKLPRRILFIKKMPRNATGKILKRELRELLQQDI